MQSPRKALKPKLVEAPQLERVALNWVHLMARNGSLGKARRAARCGASGKRRNADDGPFRATRKRARFLAFALQGAGQFWPPASLACACGGRHHGAQPALPMTKIVAVK